MKHYASASEGKEIDRVVDRLIGRFLPDSASDLGILKKRQADSWGRKSLAQNSTDRLFGVVRPEAEGGEGNKKAQ